MTSTGTALIAFHSTAKVQAVTIVDFVRLLQRLSAQSGRHNQGLFGFSARNLFCWRDFFAAQLIPNKRANPPPRNRTPRTSPTDGGTGVPFGPWNPPESITSPATQNGTPNSTAKTDANLVWPSTRDIMRVINEKQYCGK